MTIDPAPILTRAELLADPHWQSDSEHAISLAKILEAQRDGSKERFHDGMLWSVAIDWTRGMATGADATRRGWRVRQIASLAVLFAGDAAGELIESLAKGTTPFDWRWPFGMNWQAHPLSAASVMSNRPALHALTPLCDINEACADDKTPLARTLEKRWREGFAILLPLSDLRLPDRYLRHPFLGLPGDDHYKNAFDHEVRRRAALAEAANIELATPPSATFSAKIARL